jgi:hypothetical protein
MSTPSITLQNESLRMVNYEFPDPNKSYILSDAGKNYKILENGALLLSFQKGYYPQEFAIKISDVPTFSIAKKIFSGSLPISGDAKKALSLAILKAGKTTTTLKNRM